MGYWEYGEDGTTFWVPEPGDEGANPPGQLPAVPPPYEGAPAPPPTGNIAGVTPGYQAPGYVPPVVTKPVEPPKKIGDGKKTGHFYADDGTDLGTSQTEQLLGYDPDNGYSPYYVWYYPQAPQGYQYYDPNEGQYAYFYTDLPKYPELSQNPKKPGLGDKVKGLIGGVGGTSGSTSGTSASEQDIAIMQAQIKNLEAALQGMMGDRTGAGYPAKSERLVLHHNKPESMVEAALRRGLNQGYYDVSALKRMDEGVIGWLVEQTGLLPSEVKNLLGGILGAGASALTMVLSGGNFPLGAMAYFAGQGATKIALNRSSDNPLPSQKALFEGISGEGSIDGAYINSLDVTLPAGLPHEIFGGYRFVCYDKIQKAWLPSDTIYPIQYWSDEPYRYLCLDRVKQRVYHADSILKPKIYI